MADKTVLFKISADGAGVEVDAEGFVGGACSDFAQKTIDALGHVQETKDKPEMFMSSGSGVKVGH